MRAFAIIFQKELKSFFLSPLAYVVMALFTLLSGYHFVSVVKSMSVRVHPQGLVFHQFSGFFLMGFFIVFPIITMRLFSEERKMGTLEGLMTAPVRTSEVVMAKFASAVVAYLAILTPVFLFFPIFNSIVGDSGAFHSGALWGSFMILALVGMFHIAIGVLASSITQNQLIAAMITFVAIMANYMLGYLNQQGLIQQSQWSEILDYFSVVEHMQTFTDGLIDTRAMIYYGSLTAVMLALTHHILEYRKWQA